MLLDRFPDALVLTGPTGSGKTALAVELAKQLGAEIISMDSMAVYRGMDIGTAKPAPEQQREVPHHLVDVLEPWDELEALRRKAQAPCDKHEGGGCDCGKNEKPEKSNQ